jgi:hypothetical protein
MLQPNAESVETSAKGFAPAGSLLEWIDNMYQNPKTQLDRTMGKWRNVWRGSRIFPREALEKMIFKVSSYRFGSPTKHGDFNLARMHFWLPRFWGECDGVPEKDSVMPCLDTRPKDSKTKKK